MKCYDILNTYPDSLQSIYAISKLFLATIGSDTTTNTAQQLKTYYEGLILNHPNNTALVTRSNYFIQKCKVRLRDYNSALTGFSQIINQNPYSYEGLIARWDYMATSLLIQGQGGGERGISDFGFLRSVHNLYSHHTSQSQYNLGRPRSNEATTDRRIKFWILAADAPVSASSKSRRASAQRTSV